MPPLAASPDPEAIFALLQDRPGAVWLDGGLSATSGWSVLSWAPEEVVTDGADWAATGRRLSGRGARGAAPFSGGCLGYVGFSAGHRVAPVPAQAPAPEPEVWLGRFPGGLCWDHAARRWHVGGTPGFCRDARALLRRAAPLAPPEPPPSTAAAWGGDQAAFEAGVRRVLALIGAGDCYQVNLTRPVFVEGVGVPWPAWRRLRRRSSARYGAWLRLGPEQVVLSNSPELFLEVRGERVSSLPIKGTRPRHPDPDQDAALARALLDSEKDAAELTMIVDLVRNDLGRIAAVGSVEAGPRTLTAHDNVFHTAQRVSARLAPGRDAWDALAASFPPGSVTGAPKVQACRRIAELEPAPRGVYCGAIGYVDQSGDATWSVAIRTALWDRGRVRYHVGGGVVADSDPRAEWVETVDKGTALAEAFTGAARL
ncbi:MAG: anthranilate synthase component I family protein [Alphaproteobacteria bacterium]|nr:anthranilate synthase component I family protein [Alphaproteobacteria bacterium]